MQSIPQLVNDLALLLAVAAVATIVCRSCWGTWWPDSS